MNLTIPEFIPYLLAVLGLLFIWQLHDIQVKAGRIKAAGILNRSGLRFFVHVTPDDASTCPSCRDAHGKVFLPAAITAKRFSALASPCTNPDSCRCILVGLYGAWNEALRLLKRLGQSTGTLHLSAAELDGLIDGATARPAGVGMDRLSVAMLEAVRADPGNPDLAIERYRRIIETAKQERDMPFVLPAYFRLCDLLEKQNRTGEALEFVEKFSRAYGQRQGSHAATEAQLASMSLRKTRLSAAVR
jgi:hypothetical protein